ncbi:hypothetical protein PV10_07957 [Exophiala mesophila]|uniref:Uncharacterized protein n=2 Tax=Exophiala mesophila TaxID=212818 RepID=A0A0D1Z2V5_EXOME|nr:uncharacterized protein PV10_07957 [Exophiala mesophila]KIV88259.1 hypothetical protein PV10_07957 [Exophiala mesophila]
MAPLRSSRHTRNQEHNQPLRNRAGVIDWDPTDGLPVRKWEQVTVKVNQDLTADPSDSSNQNQEHTDSDFPWPEQPLPHFFSQLPPHSQELLRRARLGHSNVKPPVWDRKTETWISGTEVDARNANLKTKNLSNNPDTPASDHEEENEEENNNEDLFDVDGAAPEKRRKLNAGLQERIFETKKWVQVPTAIAEKTSEPKYLADRRSGMESLYGGAYKATHGFGSLGLNPGAGSGAAGFDLGDGSGLGNAAGVLGGNAPPEPAPVRKNMPPRRKKKKKLGGPGRRKAVPVIPGESNPAATQTANAEVIKGDPAAEAVDDSSQPGYSAAGDGGDGDGSGSDSEGEGSEEGEIDEGGKPTLENNPTAVGHSEVESMADAHADGTGLMTSVQEVPTTEAGSSVDKLVDLDLPQDTASVAPTQVTASEIPLTDNPMSTHMVMIPESAPELDGLPQTSAQGPTITTDGNPPLEVGTSLTNKVATSPQPPSLSESTSIQAHEPQPGPAATISAPIPGSPISTLNETNAEQLSTPVMPNQAAEDVSLPAVLPVDATGIASSAAPTMDLTPSLAATDPVAEAIAPQPISEIATESSQPDLPTVLPVVVGEGSEVKPDLEGGTRHEETSGPDVTPLDQSLDNTSEHTPTISTSGVVESVQPSAEPVDASGTTDALARDPFQPSHDTAPTATLTQSIADNDTDTALNVGAREAVEDVKDGGVSTGEGQSGLEGETEINKDVGLDLLGGLEKAVDLEAASDE